MKKSIKILFYISAGLIIAFLILISIYYILFSMGTAKNMSFGDKTSSKRIFIATQGSKFKNALTKEISDIYTKNKFYIEVKDVSSLPNININEWNVIIVLHTVEANKPPKSTRAFISNNIREKKIIYIATSGSGDWKHKEVDTISSASKIKEIPVIINTVKLKIDNLIP